MRKLFSIAALIAIISPILSVQTVNAQTDFIPLQPYDTVLRFYNPTTGRHVMMQSYQEAAQLNATNPAWKFEGKVFATYAYDSATQTCEDDSEPVYRFWNGSAAAHVYVMGEEVAFVEKNPAWAKEAVVFCATTEDVNEGSVPVYRYYNASSTSHVFTGSTAEKAQIEKNPAYVSEGIAFYVRERNMSEQEIFLFELTNAFADSTILTNMPAADASLDEIEDYINYINSYIDDVKDRVNAIETPEGGDEVKASYIAIVDWMGDYMTAFVELAGDTSLSIEEFEQLAEELVTTYMADLEDIAMTLALNVSEFAEEYDITLPAGLGF